MVRANQTVHGEAPVAGLSKEIPVEMNNKILKVIKFSEVFGIERTSQRFNLTVDQVRKYVVHKGSIMAKEGEAQSKLVIKEAAGSVGEAVAPGLKRKRSLEEENQAHSSTIPCTSSGIVSGRSRAQVEKGFLIADEIIDCTDAKVIDVDGDVVTKSELGEVMEKLGVWMRDSNESQKKTNRLMNAAVRRLTHKVEKHGSEIKKLGVRCSDLEWKTAQQDSVVRFHGNAIRELKTSVGLLTARVKQGIPPQNMNEPLVTRPVCPLCKKDYTVKYFPDHVCKAGKKK